LELYRQDLTYLHPSRNKHSRILEDAIGLIRADLADGQLNQCGPAYSRRRGSRDIPPRYRRAYDRVRKRESLKSGRTRELEKLQSAVENHELQLSDARTGLQALVPCKRRSRTR
jgi:hypothetical protein